MDEDAARDPEAQPRGARFPLNSRRLTAAHMRAIAQALDLPATGSTDQLRQCIEGHLHTEGREVSNTLVIVDPQAETVSLHLADAEGVFLATEVTSKQSQRQSGLSQETNSGGTGQRCDLDELKHQLQEAQQELEAARLRNEEQAEQIQELQAELDSHDPLPEEAAAELERLRNELKAEKERGRHTWKLNCEYMAELDALAAAKDDEIAALKDQLSRLQGLLDGAGGRQGRDQAASRSQVGVSSTTVQEDGAHSVTHSEGESHAPRGPRPRRGKAPPVDSFTGEAPDVRLEEWLPALERAAAWNQWSEDDQLLQLAGHLRGRALQEWDLLEAAEKATYSRAVESLRARLDPGGKAVAAQEFRHASQANGESVADFIRRLEKSFRIAYGRDKLSTETRDTLLYGQLQEGLCYDLVRAPAVSGSQTYTELCVSAKNEERRLAALKQRKQYSQSGHAASATPRTPKANSPKVPAQEDTSSKQASMPESRTCYRCGKVGHLSRMCRQPRTESGGRPAKPSGSARQVQASQAAGSSTQTPEQASPLDMLFSSSSEEEETDVRMVHLVDEGSHPRCAKVCLQGVPVYGILDSGADISIIGGNLFRKVATAARLKKRDLKTADKVPRTYDQRSFALHGRMDLDISFGDRTLRTPVYIKLDAHDQLLLSEGVCHQLGLIAYHEDVECWRGGRKQASQLRAPSPLPAGEVVSDASIPMVRVQLVHSVNLLPHQSRMVEVQTDMRVPKDMLFMLEPSAQESGAQADASLLKLSPAGKAHVMVNNPGGCSCQLEEGSVLGEATTATLVEADPEGCPVSSMSTVETVRSHESVTWRQQRLSELLGETELLDKSQRRQLLDLLAKHHAAFGLDDHERGETDLIQMRILTGDAEPKKLPARRMPFLVRQEVARQLKKMQQMGVVQPSSSPWASPVVMVCKKDGTHRFCIDYRALNSVTKADVFPLPRIDDLLDQLGEAHYFSTLDLAAGYWQIRVHPDSREKTAFITPQGLFEFCVMPFGLTNAPSVFQRLMQRVLAGLNPDEGPDFVTVYLDDILVFSRTMEDHLMHLGQVLERVEQAGLKLKPAKCRFARQEVEYLGHLVTPQGLMTNDRLVFAVQDFPRPENVHDVRRFLGLASYYRRFIPHFSRIAQPLHALTCKEATFMWTEECQAAMDLLKDRLTSAPVLAYPSFTKPYTLETDASIKGIGAVLSQRQEDGKLHPVAYASRSLSAAERNYSISELETLAVVWAISHFRSYLYGVGVTVITDHSAVKAILHTPNPSGKHARWWTRVYGSGVGDVQVVHRAGRLNASADALSRSPCGEAPAEGIAEEEVQVAVVQASDGDGTIESLLEAPPLGGTLLSFTEEQARDPEVQEVITFLRTGELPGDEKRARRLALQQSLFALQDDILFYLDPKQEHRKRAVVPRHLRAQILSENHSSLLGGHFSGKKMYGALVRHWWWDGMYSDTLHFARTCPECAIVTGGSRPHRPPLHPIPIQRHFQIVGVDVMQLPKTQSGNQYVLVFQDYLTKWPLAFPMPDQTASRIAKILVEEVIPFFGVPEALLSDRGTNILSHLMRDLCVLLGIDKLNTTAHHPQCDGMVERFNRTLKTMLRKLASKFGHQWDRHLHAVLWAYRNVPHDATGEKPSYLLFGVDLRTPTEAALMPPHALEPQDVQDYREEVTMSLSSARNLAVQALSRSQQRHKAVYDRRATTRDYRVGDWVLIKFPQEETGKLRKLSRPWHGPYRVVERRDPDLTAVKVYRPQDGQIQVHQSRVSPCPVGFPPGYYWYGNRQPGPGRPPKWVTRLLEDSTRPDHSDLEDGPVTQSEDEESSPPPEPSQPETTSTSPQDIPRTTRGGRRIVAPARLMFTRSGRAFPEGGVM